MSLTGIFENQIRTFEGGVWKSPVETAVDAPDIEDVIYRARIELYLDFIRQMIGFEMFNRQDLDGYKAMAQDFVDHVYGGDEGVQEQALAAFDALTLLYRQSTCVWDIGVAIDQLEEDMALIEVIARVDDFGMDDLQCKFIYDPDFGLEQDPEEPAFLEEMLPDYGCELQGVESSGPSYSRALSSFSSPHAIGDQSPEQWQGAVVLPFPRSERAQKARDTDSNLDDVVLSEQVDTVIAFVLSALGSKVVMHADLGDLIETAVEFIEDRVRFYKKDHIVGFIQEIADLQMAAVIDQQDAHGVDEKECLMFLQDHLIETLDVVEERVRAGSPIPREMKRFEDMTLHTAVERMSALTPGTMEIA